MSANAKQCKSCGETKPLDEYHRDKNRKDGRVTNCKRCRNRAEWERSWTRSEEEVERDRQRNRNRRNLERFRRLYPDFKPPDWL